MPNNYLSVLYKHIIQVENKNVRLKVWGGGHKHTIAPPPPIKKVGAHTPLSTIPPPPQLPTPVISGTAEWGGGFSPQLILNQKNILKWHLKISTYIVLYLTSIIILNFVSKKGNLVLTLYPHESSVKCSLLPHIYVSLIKNRWLVITFFFNSI